MCCGKEWVVVMRKVHPLLQETDKHYGNKHRKAKERQKEKKKDTDKDHSYSDLSTF